MHDEKCINALLVETKAGRQAVRSEIFIDCSGDGDLAAWAGAKFEVGDDAGGVDAPGRKVTEEATEVLMAAKDDAVAAPESRAATRDALTGEVADLLYHTLVLLRERDLAPAAVIARLRERHNA